MVKYAEEAKIISKLIVMSLLISTLVVCLIYPTSNYTENDSVMTCDGEFDRVVLSFRYYQASEKEGVELAVLYDSGSTTINGTGTLSNTYYRSGNTYLFFLYIYKNGNYTRNQISVLGGVNETINLDGVTTTLYLYSHYSDNAYTFAFVNVFIVFSIVFPISRIVVYLYANRERDDDYSAV